MQYSRYNGAMEQELKKSFPLFATLSREDQQFIATIVTERQCSYQQIRLLIEQATDLTLWQQPSISVLWDEESGGNREGKPRTKVIIANLLAKIDSLRQAPTDYNNFLAKPIARKKATHVVLQEDAKLLGSCPCPIAGEKTRCCNLLTLDAVRQCAFGCSYCSIQSFYHKDEVLFVKNLQERLDQLQLPEGTWHIGTGQSSDSLMWGNAYGLLDSLSTFAHQHPEIVLELKTKSDRTDWINTISFPSNVVATWSLNAPTIIEKEEHLTASLGERLAAARQAADAGLLVGFHLHPMVHFSGWQDEYGLVIESILNTFSPREVMMISLGTLTFTKEVLRQLRSSRRPSRILQMELTEAAGKFSYPVAVKKDLFSFAYNQFPAEWKQKTGPFYYLCMELPELWEPIFGYAYPDNASFEADMKRRYQQKIETISK